MDDIVLRYPQVEHYLKQKHLRDFSTLWKDLQGNESKEIGIEAFKLALCHADSQVKSLPATAQVYISPVTLTCADTFCCQTSCTFFKVLLYPGCCPTGCISS